MLIDYLSPSAYGRYNKKLASLIGLETAIYWEVLKEIFSTVIRKDRFTDENLYYFKVDRKFIESETSLTKSQQSQCDAILIKFEMLEHLESDNDQIRISLDNEICLISTSTKSEINEIKKISKVATKEGKDEGKKIGITNRLKKLISELETDSDLQLAYYNWIDAVYDKGVMQNAKVKLFKDEVDAATDSKEAKMYIINAAISFGYVKAEWAINRCPKELLQKQKVATGKSAVVF